MTTCYFWLIDDNIDSIKKVRIEGHAGFQDYGKDIVCSAISTLMISSCNLLEKVSPKNKIFSDEKKGIIELEVMDDDKMNYLITNNLYESLVDLSSQYPRFIKILKEEITC